MKSELSIWLDRAMKHAHLSQPALATQLTERLPRVYDRSIVNKMRLAKRKISAEELMAIEEITGLPAPSQGDAFGVARVPLLSWVSAGELVDATSQVPVDDVPILAVSGVAGSELFALRVEGDSMDRISPDQSVIVVDRSDTRLLPNRFYVFSVGGETTFKRWHADPPYLAPFSTNAVHEPKFLNRRADAKVIGRVRRTMLDL